MACRIKTSTSSDHATFEDVRSAMHSKTAMMEAGGGKCIHRVNKICASRPYVCCAERFRASRASRVGSSVSARWRLSANRHYTTVQPASSEDSQGPFELVTVEVVWVVGPAFGSSSDEGRANDDVPASGLAAGRCPIWHPLPP